MFITSVLALVLMIFLIWVVTQGSPLCSKPADDLKGTVLDAGHDVQSAGRDAADSIRRSLQ